VNRSPGPARPPRYEREIEQVLRRSHGGRRRWRLPRPKLPILRMDWQTGVALGWVLILGAFVLRYVTQPWAFQTMRWLVLAGAVLLVLGYVAALFPRQPRYQKRWRGEVLQLPGEESAWRRTLRRFFHR